MLKKGDVIRLDTRVNSEIIVSIDNKRKLAGRPGGVDGKKAIRITRTLEGEDLLDADTLTAMLAP
jgi:flagellar motor switch protein FliM